MSRVTCRDASVVYELLSGNCHFLPSQVLPRSPDRFSTDKIQPSKSINTEFVEKYRKSGGRLSGKKDEEDSDEDDDDFFDSDDSAAGGKPSSHDDDDIRRLGAGMVRRGRGGDMAARPSAKSLAMSAADLALKLQTVDADDTHIGTATHEHVVTYIANASPMIAMKRLSLRGTKLFSVEHSSFWFALRGLCNVEYLDLADTHLGAIKEANDGKEMVVLVDEYCMKTKTLSLANNFMHEQLFDIGIALRENNFESLLELDMSWTLCCNKVKLFLMQRLHDSCESSKNHANPPRFMRILHDSCEYSSLPPPPSPLPISPSPPTPSSSHLPSSPHLPSSSHPLPPSFHDSCMTHGTCP